MAKDVRTEKAVIVPELKGGYNFKNVTDAVLQNQQGQPDQGQQPSGSQDSGQSNTSQQTAPNDGTSGTDQDK